MNSAGEARYDSAVDDDGRGLTRYVERAEGTRHDATASDQWDSAHYSVPVSAGRSESLVSPNGAPSTSPPLYGGPSNHEVPNYPQFYQYPQSVNPGSLHLWMPHFTWTSLADPLSLCSSSPASVMNAPAPLGQESPIYAPSFSPIYTPGHNFGHQAVQNHSALSLSSTYPIVSLHLTNSTNQSRSYPHGPPSPIQPEINTQWLQHSSNSSPSFPQTQVNSKFRFTNAVTTTQGGEVIQRLEPENYSSSGSFDQSELRSIGRVLSSESPNRLPIVDNMFDRQDSTQLSSLQNEFSQSPMWFNDRLSSGAHTTTFPVNGPQRTGATIRTRARHLKPEEIPLDAMVWFLSPGARTEDHRKVLKDWGRMPEQVYKLFYREISGKMFCTYCQEERSALQNRLEEHANVHVGFRPYICSTCGKAYSRKENHNRDHPFEPDVNFG